MRILQEKPREGLVRLKTESLDDLWELSHILAEGDEVRASTERKVQVGEDRSKQERKRMTLTLTATKIELEHGSLRILGTIAQGPEEWVSYGDHHSFTIKSGDELTITKEWDRVEKQRLKEAAQAAPLDILLVTFDRESAYLAELTRRGYDIIQTLKGDVAKKGPGGGEEDFWATLADAIATLDARNDYSTIIAASPAFWTDYLTDALTDRLRKKVKTASCSAVGEAALAEVVKRPELEQALEADRTSREEKLVTRVLDAIGADKACYGKEECEKKASIGQVELLVVTHTLIEEARKDGWYDELDNILETAQGTGAQVHLVEHVVDQLDSLGGIAGVLRW